MKRKLILKNFLSPGDVVMLTAALRDLHRSYPETFITDVRTPYPELWKYNPYLTPLDESMPDVTSIDCQYPLVNQSNTLPYHFIQGFIDCLNARLNLNIRATSFKGDIYISEEEKRWFSQVHECVGAGIPFWLIVAGGKPDIPIKWWSAERYQEVVDYFRGKIQFVQVGLTEYCHPHLTGVIDLVGQTDLRQLIRLVYHADGAVSPVTSLMHLAAAVEMKRGVPQNRPCVVIAGGREPAHWEAYPHHQFIHTNGALPCCLQGGCWKTKTILQNEDDERTRQCVDMVGSLPRCMDMILARDVIERIEFYYAGGALGFAS